MTAADPWLHLAGATPARIALGRVGAGLPTRAVLDFSLAHARARDAVHASFDAEGLAALLGEPALVVESRAVDRALYLRRPDFGRLLAPASRALLEAMGRPGGDIAIIVADGLSAAAARAHAPHLVAALRESLARAGLALAPLVVARGARVALGDVIGEALGAQAALMLIGERPGLSSPDSLGAYLTLGPRPGRADAERNCVSNIRPEGLPVQAAAFRLTWLIQEAFRRGITGVDLKDESQTALEG